MRDRNFLNIFIALIISLSLSKDS